MLRESTGKTFLVAGLLCIFCSVLVSSAAVGLRERQVKNQELDIKKNIIAVAELGDDSKTVEEIFNERIEARIVELATGEYVSPDVIDPATYDQLEASRDPERSEALSSAEDLGGIGRRANYSFVYLVKGDDGSVDQFVMPVKGKGLWSTLYGFVSLGSDLQTIRGLTFYQHAETPGLGGEVDNPKWKAQWPGKQAFGDDGEVRIEVLKGQVPPNDPNSKYQVDGLSGATITAKGVSQLLRFWLDDKGFGPFIEKQRANG